MRWHPDGRKSPTGSFFHFPGGSLVGNRRVARVRPFGWVGHAQAGNTPVVFLPMLALSGCAVGGAPSIPFFGAYFPAWMLAALVGVAVAILAKLILIAAGLQATMPWQLAVCSGIGLIAAIAVGLLAFG